ncbi:uncharacterized protein LOC128551190 [Mercenaria mercenaria]|uniref:uncharacterized protein LOC128551190 n=1 Tax=Mercenaria mercenaria TaxID=6596 RepID=UPI00234E65B3|nr:uncharacterized protein LOC128551190 [Mercenaria mercenaria]
MTLFFYVFLLLFSQYSVFCNDATGIQALVTRIDALEEIAEIQKKTIQRQEENIHLLRVKDENQQRRFEELEKIVQLQQKVISDVISGDKQTKDQRETPEVAAITDNLPVDVSRRNMSLISGLEQINISENFATRHSTRQTPEIVAFHATVDVHNHVTHLTQGQTVVFDSVHLNVGGGYHSSAGIFIAPSAGIYIFSLSVMLNTASSHWIDLDLIKNGAVLSGAYAFEYAQGSVSIVTQLKIGDEVLVKVHASDIGILYGDKLTSFMGALIMHL